MRSKTRLRLHDSVLLIALSLLALVGGGFCLDAEVVISEIMYHPVEEPAFDADGGPLISLYDDVFEYIEIFNGSSELVLLSGWQIEGGISFEFTGGEKIGAGEYRVIARDPDRLATVGAYHLERDQLWGPYRGTLSNRGESIRLLDQSSVVVDAVTYSDRQPWPISADALGVGQRWSGIDPLEHQYRGRSLERVSLTHDGQDAANWIASPLEDGPSPGRPNLVSNALAKSIVTECLVTRKRDGNRVISPNETVLIEVSFSSLVGLGQVFIEYFVDDIDLADEAVSRFTMIPLADHVGHRFGVTLPGEKERSVVRYRILADRGEGLETVYPRRDDPMEWYAYFVTPERESEYPIYDVFVSQGSLRRLERNIAESPKRVTSPNPPGLPREEWNATEPAIFVHDGIVYDAHIRYHGSRYRRSTGRQSYKLLFPDYQLFRDHDSVFLTDKDFATSSGHLLFRLTGLPTSTTQTIDLRLNKNRPLLRLEQEEYNQCLLERYYREMPVRSPERAILPTGALFKSVGNLDGQAEGPFGIGNGSLLEPVTPRRQETPVYWTPRQRYEHTYRIQNQGWMGHSGFQEMIEALWAARKSNTPELALRKYFFAHWDIDDTLTYLAMINWMSPWDDVTHNYFLWQKRNGLWSILPWDFDSLFGGNSTASASIMTVQNFAKTMNIFKDSFLQAFPDEFKERIWVLNNTLLHPENLARIGLDQTVLGFSNGRFDSVNRQADQGEYRKPLMPINLFPTGGQGVSESHQLQSSPFAAHESSTTTHMETIWEIRGVDGSFELPVFRLASRDRLTSLRLPSEALEYGARYFWRCLYVDSEGFRSLYSDESSFIYGAAYDQMPLITLESEWRFRDTGENQGVSWRQDSFDDSEWPLASGRFSTAILDENQDSIPLQKGSSSYYFRTPVTLGKLEPSQCVVLTWEAADGGVMYVNGKEVFRRRISRSRSVRFATLAEKEIEAGRLDGPIELPASIFREGKNLVAVEIHPNDPESSDVAFSLDLKLIRSSLGTGLSLSELMAANDGIVEKDGLFPDWVELVNSSEQAIDLANFGLTDDLADLDRFRFPGGSSIAAGERLVVWCDHVTDGTGYFTGFRLARAGEQVVLVDWRGEFPIIRDLVIFGQQLGDSSLSRNDDGTTWGLGTPTPGAENRFKLTGRVQSIRINEWTAGDDQGNDWIELINGSDLVVNLGAASLSDRPDEPFRFQFEPYTFVGPGDFLVLGSNGAEVSDLKLPFRLDRAGEMILLNSSEGNQIDVVGWQSQALGVYHGRLPDARGVITSNLLPTPGEMNRAESDRDGDGIPNEIEMIFQLNAELFSDATLDTDQDGVCNYREFVAGTDPTDPESRLEIRSVSFEDVGFNPGLVVTFEGMKGKSYSLQMTSGLDELFWESIIQIGPLENDGISSVSAPLDDSARLGFLRIVTPQEP